MAGRGAGLRRLRPRRQRAVDRRRGEGDARVTRLPDRHLPPRPPARRPGPRRGSAGGARSHPRPAGRALGRRPQPSGVAAGRGHSRARRLSATGLTGAGGGGLGRRRPRRDSDEWPGSRRRHTLFSLLPPRSPHPARLRGRAAQPRPEDRRAARGGPGSPPAPAPSPGACRLDPRGGHRQPRHRPGRCSSGQLAGSRTRR